MEELQPQTPQAPELSIAQRLERSLKREAGEEWEPPQPEAAPAEEPEAPETESAEADEAAPTEEPDEGEPAAEPTVAEVEIEGKTYKVPPELKDGYLRQADYTKKTQAVAEERKAVEQMKALTEQSYQAVHALGPVIADWHQAQKLDQQYGAVDWQALWDSNPELHNKVKMEAQENRQKLANLGQMLQQAPALLNDLQHKSMQAEVARNLPLAREWVPDLDKRRDELTSVAREYGYSDAEISTIVDARQIRALRDLADFKKIQAGKEKIRQQVTAAPPVARPGTRTAPSTAQKNYNAALKSLQNGDRSDDTFVSALRAQRKLTG